MKKRIISFFLLGIMTMSLLAGCGSKETSNGDVPNTEVTENMPISESVETTELENEIVTEVTEATEVIEETETQQEQPETTEQPEIPSEPTEPSQPDSRYGGYWDYVDNSNLTYTGASLYTNTTYGTSFTVPTTAEVGTNLFCQQSCGFDQYGKHVLAIASIGGVNIGITLLMYDSSYASSGSELWNKESMYDPFNYNLTAEYDTTIGGNSYHCYEYSLQDGRPVIWLTRNANGMLIHYRISNCSSLDTVKQYILY